MASHDCPVCGVARVPHQYATCRPCWGRVPVGIRRRLTESWATRSRDPRRHREVLAELLLWARDRRPDDDRG